MKNTKRALRRHHRQRMIRRAYRSYVLSMYDDPQERRRVSSYWADNLQICSCYGCGNPRKHNKRPPAQERRINEAARYELREGEAA